MLQIYIGSMKSSQKWMSEPPKASEKYNVPLKTIFELMESTAKSLKLNFEKLGNIFDINAISSLRFLLSAKN